MQIIQLNDLPEKEKQLCYLAMKMVTRAYIEYSHFAVGAALLTTNNKVFLGCNVECADYLGLHAEHLAIGQKIANGDRSPIKSTAIALFARNKQFAAPCGDCRQKIREHSLPDTKVLGVRLIQGEKDVEILDVQIFTIAELLPYSFGPNNLVK